ncbi:MAG: branched-chain amino acid aminotransferase [Fimbriimonadaceae bacterium]|nr:branched-chain amino acid aminotransferase [Chitinophagales bacterium]
MDTTLNISTNMEIPVTKIKESKINEVDLKQLQFGKITSDHMFIAKYKDGNWQNTEIIPYSDISLAPTALCFHYGQTTFEGMKAFRMKDGNVSIFRMEKHFERINKSLDRMCMANVDEELFFESIKKLIALDQQWVPEGEGTSLYIRPFMIATEERFGVKESDEYLFIIFSGPVPQLFHKPIKVKVETKYVRAAKGGTGYAKCGGNYGAAFYPTKIARQEGYNAVLWTDSKENKYIEESGTMNVMFIINNVLITPPLSTSILDGITRDSVLVIAGDMGMKVEEREIAQSKVATPKAESKEALHDKLAKSIPAKESLAEKMEGTPIPDLKKAISLNQRFQFSRELFKGNNQEYEVSIDKLNTASRDEAMKHLSNLKSKFTWNDESPVTHDFIELVERRHS